MIQKDTEVILMDIKNASFSTQAVHAGQHGDPVTGALVSPLFMTSTYSWTEEKLERYLTGDREGIFTYGRSRNPTQNELQDKLSLLEGGEAALITASGMAAISLAILSFVHPGDHIISSKTVYGGTYALFTKIFEELKIDVTFVDDMNPSTLDKAFKKETKMVYTETICNPSMTVNDIEAISKWTKSKDILLIVDNTFCSPYICKPLEIGADVVVNSTTKYINGHGDIIGGSICGPFKFVDNIRGSIYQELGPVPSPFSCWLMLRGLKTLPLRMKAHCEGAMEVAKWLEANSKVEKVMYPGLESHSDHLLAKKMMGDKGYGGMISFIIKGGMDAGKTVLYNVEMCKLAVSLGDLDTLIEQPATMTHGKIAPAKREAMGVPDGLIRLSVGIEDPKDIIADLEKAFSNVK